MNLADIFESGKLRPLHDYVAVRRIDATKKIGSIWIPDHVAEKDRPFEGIVVAVGPGRVGSDGRRRAPPPVKVGERVVFKRYAGAESALMSDDLWMIRGPELEAVFEST